MARKYIVVDDFTGKEVADSSLVTEGFSFSVQGDRYIIDLSKESEDKFRKALEPFISKATLQGPMSVPIPAVRADRTDSAAIRAWYGTLTVAQLQEHGIMGVKMNERGRIPTAVAAAYEKVHTKTPDETPAT